MNPIRPYPEGKEIGSYLSLFEQSTEKIVTSNLA